MQPEWRDISLVHKTPCNACPWRKESAQGYLGGHDPLWYADAVAANEIPTCHLTEESDERPDDVKTAYCVGALQCAANSAIAPIDKKAQEAKAIVGRSDKVFGHYSLFYNYHAGEPYVSRFMRGPK